VRNAGWPSALVESMRTETMTLSGRRGMVRTRNHIMPGEFEAQAAVWLGWPTRQWFRDPRLDTRRSIAQIARILSDYRIASNIMCTNDRGIFDAREWMRRYDYPVTSYMNFLPLPQVDIWVRDYGPVFVRDLSTDRLAIASYRQNQWGYSTTDDPISRQMSALPGLVARFLGMETVVDTDVVSEGGGRIQNGRGVLLVGRAVEFQRNPQATREELEAAYRTTLGATRIIWLNAGLCEDMQANLGPISHSDAGGATIRLYGPQTTGGHLDEFCRFAGPKRIVLAQVGEEEAAADPIAAVNRERLEEACRILSEETDQDGEPFEILRIPAPDPDYMLVQPDEPMYSDFLANLDYPEDVPRFPRGRAVHIVKPSSYANYFAVNGLVIAPRYGNSIKDRAAARVLEKAFPGREVVQMDPSPLNYAGGGIHCVTQQQPVGEY